MDFPTILLHSGKISKHFVRKMDFLKDLKSEDACELKTVKASSDFFRINIQKIDTTNRILSTTETGNNLNAMQFEREIDSEPNGLRELNSKNSIHKKQLKLIV